MVAAVDTAEVVQAVAVEAMVVVALAVAVVDMVNHHPEILEYLVDMAIVVVMSGVVHCLRDLVAVQS